MKTKEYFLSVKQTVLLKKLNFLWLQFFVLSVLLTSCDDETKALDKNKKPENSSFETKLPGFHENVVLSGEEFSKIPVELQVIGANEVSCAGISADLLSEGVSENGSEIFKSEIDLNQFSVGRHLISCFASNEYGEVEDAAQIDLSVIAISNDNDPLFAIDSTGSNFFQLELW